MDWRETRNSQIESYQNLYICAVPNPSDLNRSRTEDSAEILFRHHNSVSPQIAYLNKAEITLRNEFSEITWKRNNEQKNC